MFLRLRHGTTLIHEYLTITILTTSFKKFQLLFRVYTIFIFSLRLKRPIRIKNSFPNILAFFFKSRTITVEEFTIFKLSSYSKYDFNYAF